MFILCKPFGGYCDKVLLNISEVAIIEVKDNIITAYTEGGEGYLVSYHADEKGFDGWESTTFETFIKAIEQKWPTFCGFLDNDGRTEGV